MNIKCKKKIIIKTQEEFHAIDKIVTGFAFDIHNDIGNFCDENIYQEVMAVKCNNASIITQKEVEIVVTYKDFIKTYRLDLLVDNGIIYELKAVKSLSQTHTQQLINYLLLTGLKHGKLLNFHSSSVEYKYVSTSLTQKDRYQISINADQFIELTDKCIILKNILDNILKKWGAYLDCKLYNDALIHFLGGWERIINSVDIIYENKIVGKQKMQMLNKRTVFHVSSINKASERYQNNIRRLIKHTNINAVQWVNFNKNNNQKMILSTKTPNKK